MIRKLAHVILNLRDIFVSCLSKLQIRIQGGIIEDNVQFRGLIFIRNRGVLNIKKGSVINSSRRINPAGLSGCTTITVQEGATLEIGEYSGISNSTIYCSTNIRIGSFVMIGVDCRIYDWDFHPVSHLDRRNPLQPNIKTAPVLIDDDVFIGAGCLILKGVKIGQGAIIGSGSVVTKNVPSFQLWAGNPARFIREL